ncbi:hypothetical protein BDW22DRAFT_426668 [Trametopsis cervina]|nr:hypothetical protein BDW22DRAFT_426668 [Trametopsis cervina]
MGQTYLSVSKQEAWPSVSLWPSIPPWPRPWPFVKHIYISATWVWVHYPYTLHHTVLFAMSATETFPTHHMFLDYPIGNLPGWLVPQEWYTPATSKTDIDIKHYLPVQFFDSLYELGMPLTQFSETDTDVPRTPTPKNTVSRGTDETETEIHHVHILATNRGLPR